MSVTQLDGLNTRELRANDKNNGFFALFDAVSRIHTDCGDGDKLCKAIAKCAADLCDSEGAFLLLLDPNTSKLNFAASNGLQSIELSKLSLGVGEGIAGWVAENKRHLVINGSTDSSEYAENLSSILEKTGFLAKTLMAVPVSHNDTFFGVLEVINKNGDLNFEVCNLEQLELFAAQCGIAIKNSNDICKLHDQLSINLNDMQGGTENSFKPIIAKSPVMKEKLEIIKRLAITDSSVLILGESGVGKELIAEHIHYQSERKNKPFIRVNCAALPDDLAESELFGHTKGAFTGAVSERKGRFEQAHTGTIFLDEIADMSLSLQAKILRVLQEKTFEKIGSDKKIIVDVRILAATNKDIEKLIQEGGFRKDLYYRLNVLPLFIPPLRQRTEDIRDLAVFFLHKIEGDMKKHFKGFSDEAMEAMIAYSWHGNIRELQNCVERSCVICKTDTIEKQDLLISTTNDYNGRDGIVKCDLKTALDSFKARFIRSALEANKWNQTETAKVLDIQRTYLSRLLKELNIKLR
ncbi:MAG: sigma 54-interacting transcriptional regulator [Termitinemataceae bacterium]|nr:MAG: sigma 54-interacting transcriptional regulator [Termitinemataceae bacterium]